ncbi:MAG: hypothetical protein MSIBF_06140 [Candidatus Altiarchaeales archaeon IMC4]|nr:MAG: hypothetical protein MSIBF_06140 [Candidatus Altiarchaeales archaeon IMC4]
MKKVCLILVILAVCTASGQMFPYIGTVVAGAVTYENQSIANATVTVVVERTGQTKTTATSADDANPGSYSFIQLNAKAGDVLTATAAYGNLQGNGSVVCDGSTLPQRINIELHEVKQSIKITAGTIIIVVMALLFLLTVLVIKRMK